MHQVCMECAEIPVGRAPWDEGRKKMATLPEHLEREWVLRRLSDPEGDDELHAALDRLRKNFYQLWRVLEELRVSDDPGALLSEWREAPKGSQGWRKALFYDQALEVLSVALSGC